ncbi:MAG: metal-dependent hydrolase [Ignavibacteria bacterium]|nr:metal-dependent hydrolase [Ignavibacteria bacterium]
MFIGHFGVGLAAKKADTRVSLGTYFIAAQFIDLLWPILLMLGIEKVEIAEGISKAVPLNFVSYPVSHSLIMVLVWGVLFGLVYKFIKKDTKGAIILALCVVSHWVLDLIVHIPDLPLYPGNSPKVGFGLWNSLAVSITLEMLIFFTGVFTYNSVTKAKNRKGSVGFWLLIVFFLIIHFANIFGPPPPSVTAIAWSGQLQWIFVIWAYWADKNRTSRK